MNVESLLNQFSIVEASITRARLPFETRMLQKQLMEVTLYELIKSREQLLQMIQEIDPTRFGPTIIQIPHTPIPNIEMLNVCPFCGSNDCQSDHK